MSNAYFIATPRNREFSLQAEIRELGLSADCPKVRRSKVCKDVSRSVRHYDVAMIPGYIFAAIPPVYFTAVKELRDVVRMYPIVSKEWGACVQPFLRSAQREYAASLAAEAGSEALSPYTAGDALSILKGHLSGMPATFQEAVKRAHDDHARIRANVEFMGQVVTVDLDPVNVEKAG